MGVPGRDDLGAGPDTGTNVDGAAAPADTPSRILDVAERLVQTRGFNGFSYADVASELEISKASLHYHFPSKAALGEALIERYGQRFFGALGSPHEGADARSRLEAYVEGYAQVLREGRMCLCGMLAAEYRTLPEAMQDAVTRYFRANEDWLQRVLERGRSEGSIGFDGDAGPVARMIVGTLEGAMLIARPLGEQEGFRSTAKGLLAGLTSPRG